MSEAAATPAPELPLTLEELVAAHNALLARLIAEEGALRRSLDAAKMSPGRMMTDVMLIEALNRIADVQVDVRASGKSLRQAAMFQTFGEVRQAVQAAPQPEPARRRHRSRHRSAGKHALRSVPGIAVVLGVLRAAKTAVKGSRVVQAHPWVAAHLTHLAVTAGGAVVLTAAVAVAPSSAVSLPWTAGTGSSPGASVSASATPLPSSSLIASLTRPEAKARSARKVPAPLVPPFTSPASPSSPAPAASPSPSPSSPPPPAPGVLVVSTTAIDLTVNPQVTITLSAYVGRVDWSVTPQGSDLDFSQTSGTLKPGQTYQLVVSLDASQDGNASEVFEVNNQQVTVTLPPLPPLPVVTDSPTPDPTSS